MMTGKFLSKSMPYDWCECSKQHCTAQLLEFKCRLVYRMALLQLKRTW